MSCGVGRRRGSDPKLLWLWRGLAATAPIRPLAWELPYAVGAALEKTKKDKKKKKKKKKKNLLVNLKEKLITATHFKREDVLFFMFQAQ